MQITRFFWFSLLVIFGLVACGGGSGGSEGNPPSSITSPSSLNVTAASNGQLTITGRADPSATVTVQFPDGSTVSTTADQSGFFTLSSSTPQQSYATIRVTSSVSSGQTAATYIESSIVLKALYQATGILPGLSFEPSLGINTEAPQGGADTAGNPMPFADIFRTARPFAELSSASTVLDSNGWPMLLDPLQGFARTKLLQGALAGSIPDGVYTVIYEGNGTLQFSGGPVKSVQKVAGVNKYLLNLAFSDFDSNDDAQAADTNAINLVIRDINPGDYISNIRFIMPGGTCTGNPFLRVSSSNDCPVASNYESFIERLQTDRNTIIFNPDYMLFLRQFKVVRLMNLMESSLKELCTSLSDCPAGVGSWDSRAKMTDAVWGGNDGRTPAEQHKGVPVEVVVALANTLQRDIWINIPHIATDNYITQLATALNNGLNTSITVYLEYSNEVWNSGFAANTYMTAKGQSLNLGSIPAEYQGTNRDSDYFARLRYHAQRSVEIFNLFQQQFNGQVVRVLGSFIGDKILTREKLKFLAANSPNSVDAVAVAPYFYGCPRKAVCPSASSSLLEATNVDDVFAAIDQNRNVDVKSLDGTFAAIEGQLAELTPYNVSLVTYEGGQHLVTSVFGVPVSEVEKSRLRALFNAANRDARMKDRYLSLLNQWKGLSNQGATLFMLYTLPQAYYRFGNFGIKEHLNKTRAESPKFDGVMEFQEQAGRCWWAGC